MGILITCHGCIFLNYKPSRLVKSQPHQDPGVDFRSTVSSHISYLLVSISYKAGTYQLHTLPYLNVITPCKVDIIAFLSLQ